MADSATPGELLAGNIAAAMARRRLQQSDFAARMQALGYKWVRQTVGEILKGNRRLLAEELYGVAVALEIPITTLVVPWADSVSTDVVLPSGLTLEFSTQFHIRNVPWAPIMWHGNEPKFEPTDTVLSQEHSTAHREAGD